MGSYSNSCNLSCFFQEHGTSLAQFNLVKTTDYSTGSAWVSAGWPFDVRGPKTPPSDHDNTAIFWTCVIWKSYVAQIHLCRATITCLQLFFPTSQTALFLYPINIPNPSPLGRPNETCSPISSLACLIDKPFLCCRPQYLSIWIAAPQANNPVLVTNLANQPGGKSRWTICCSSWAPWQHWETTEESKQLPGPFVPGTVPRISSSAQPLTFGICT